MTSNLQRSFERLESQKAAFLAETSLWSAERLHFRPAHSSWSALDVIDHLVKVEQALVRAVRSSLPHGHPQQVKERVGALLVFLVMRSPIRIKVPASAGSVLPEITADPILIVRQWDDLRIEMEDLVKGLLPAQLRCGLFRHPVSGWMTMSQALAFLSAHLRHHGYQLTRLERATRAL